MVLDFPASTLMHIIIYHDHAVNKFTKLVTLDLLATNVLSRAKVQLIKISAILKNLDFWSNLVLHCTKLCTCIIGSKSQTTNSQKSPTPPWNKSHLYIITMTKKEVLKVLDNIFVAINYGLANCIMIEADL